MTDESIRVEIPSHYAHEGEPPATSEAWASRRRYAAALRRLGELAVTHDLDEAQLDRLTAALEEQITALETADQQYGKNSRTGSYADALTAEQQALRNVVSHELSPLVGLANPLAPPLNMWFDGDKVHGRVTLGWQYEGPPGCAHGGYVAAIFDEFLGSGQLLAERPGPTGTLSLRYLKPTPLNTELCLTGWVERQDSRKNLLHGELSCDGQVLVSAEGLFILIPPERHHPNAGTTGLAAD